MRGLVGSVKAGPKVAAILPVVESCRRLNVPVKEYLAAVLPGLDRRKFSSLPSPGPPHAAEFPGLVRRLRSTLNCFSTRQVGAAGAKRHGRAGDRLDLHFPERRWPGTAQREGPQS